MRVPARTMRVALHLSVHIVDGVVEHLLDRRVALWAFRDNQGIEPLQPALHHGDQVFARRLLEHLTALLHHVHRRRVGLHVDRPHMPGNVLATVTSSQPAASFDLDILTEGHR